MLISGVYLSVSYVQIGRKSNMFKDVRLGL